MAIKFSDNFIEAITDAVTTKIWIQKRDAEEYNRRALMEMRHRECKRMEDERKQREGGGE